jgi:hypothetical protein
MRTIFQLKSPNIQTQRQPMNLVRKTKLIFTDYLIIKRNHIQLCKHHYKMGKVT